MRRGLFLLGLLPLLAPEPVRAQLGIPGLEGRGAASDEPVTFTAEEVEFDQNSDTVTARGRVEAWQGDRVLRADQFTYNRTTGVATASGNVVLIEPDGQILFADRAELSGGMRDAVLEGIRGLLAGNARVAAAGARRTGGDITDLARVVYSPCNLCPEDPDRPPLWQLRAGIASLHSQEQRVRYRDASLELFGLPMFYAPYFSHAAPGAPRISGFLSPTFGITQVLGGFYEQPYYWVIDDSSDATIRATLSTEQVGGLALAYRRRFNTGVIALDGSFGNLTGSDLDEQGMGWNFFSQGAFSLDENWRTGFALNRASSADYLRAYRYGSPQTLTSNAFLEGFWGTQGYVRGDSRLYQSLLQTNTTGQTPLVLPYGYAEWLFERDRLGGQFRVDAQGYSIFRSEGTNSRRVGTRAEYELPLVGHAGEIWTIRGRADLLAGYVQDLQEAPFFGPPGQGGNWTMGNVRGAVDLRYPLARSAGQWGSQIIEPRVQFVTGPQTGTQTNIPAEDSLDLEFTDATLFELNRYPGRDRQEGGTRVDAALRGAWLFPNGGQLEGLVGRSFRTSDDPLFPPGSGLENQRSDYVARARLAPVPWFEMLGRSRYSAETGQQELWDITGTVFAGNFSLSGGFLGTQEAPNGSYPKRNEISAGGFLRINENWRVGAFGRYDRFRDEPVAAQGILTYEDECLIFETRLIRRWIQNPSTLQDDPTGTMLLFRVTLKTIGDFGIRAL
ncbi:LPS-assembly protein LptD [Roseomonas sp. AR75]|uniref:LPS-assembly protein LptD n=1 Tax=Roseomonas sp. AR75 TaxID=2562311 RepID=UPI0010C06AFB|nr:LPS assembly protein LptD [Roseomonas sp. AR75]